MPQDKNCAIGLGGRYSLCRTAGAVGERDAAAGADLSSIKDAANNLGAALAARHGAACRVVVNDESRFILILTDFDAEGGAQ